MARKKPSFGGSKWIRFEGDRGPFPEPIYNITDLQRFDGYLTVGNTSRREIQVLSQFAFPLQVAAYREWAVHNPTMDPRTWLPLAEGGVKPDSPEGQAISNAASTADLASGIGGYATPSSVVSGSGTKPQNAPALGAVPDLFASMPSKVAQGGDEGPLTGFMNAVGGAVSTGYQTTVDSFQTAARAVQYAGMFAYNAGQALPRNQLGYNEQIKPVQQKYLNEGIGLEEGDFDNAMTRANNESLGQGWWDRKTTEQRAALERYVQEARALADAQPSAVDQTEVGQIIKAPELLTQDTGWLGGNPAIYMGTVDPTTGQTLINPTTGKPFENRVPGTEAESLRAYDMRTQEEIARGVAPVGWTPGRGIAHVWYAPDTTQFNVLSGIVDFNTNLFLDPVNLIPVGGAGKVVKGGGRVAAWAAEHLGADPSRIPGAIERGMLLGDKVGVQTTQVGFKGARGGAAGKKVVDSLELSGRVVDPDLAAATGAKFDHETGLVTSPHGNIVMGENAWNFLNSGRGSRMIDDLVGTDSAAEVWLRSNRKIDAALAKQIAETKDAATMRAVIGTRLGMDLNDPAALRNFGSQAPGLFKNMALRDNGLLQMLRKAPHAKPIDLENTDHAITMLERFGRGAGMKWEDVRPHLDNLIATNPYDAEGLYKAVYGVEGKGGFFGAVSDHLANDVGIDPELANQVTRAFKGGLDEETKNFVNSAVADLSTGGGATADNVGYAMLESEMFNRLAAIPDYRTVRSLGNSVGRIMRSSASKQQKYEWVADKINGATTAWKSAVLLRPAYVAREVGEMTVAASLAGYSGLFTHPARFTSLMLSTIAQKEAQTAAGRVAKAITRGEVDPRSGNIVQGLGKDTATLRAVADWLHLTQGMKTLFPALDQTLARVNGEAMWAEMNRAMGTGDMRGLPAMYDSMAAVSGNFSVDEGLGRLASRQVGTVTADSAVGGAESALNRKRYINGMIEQLAQAARDGDMRALASGDFTRAVADSQFSGRITKKRTALSKKYAALSDEQILQDHATVLQTLTGNDADLITAISKGAFEGGSLSRTNKALRAKIAAMLDDDAVRVGMKPIMRYDRAEIEKGLRSQFDKTMERFFEGTGEISDMLARGPLVREAYVNRVVELVPHMTPAAKAEAIKKIRETGDVTLARKIAKAGKANGVLDAEDVDHIASTFARQESRRVFYDAHERQNYALAMRAVAPFAQATFNTIRRWGELSMRNPQLMYRTLKPLNYATQPGSAVIYGALGSLYGDPASALYDPTSYGYSTPDTRHNSVDGFFYTDANGDRKFTYPVLGLLGELVGLPAAAMNSSSLSGLNVAGTTIQPGFGPAVTLPAAFIPPIGDALSADGQEGEIARFLFPYGLPQGSLPEKVYGAFAPSWAAKVARADDQDTQANLATKLVPVLLQQGGYDPSSAADQGRLWNDATNLASRLYWWNAIMGSMTPSTVNTKTAIRPTGPGGQFVSDQSALMAQQILDADPTDEGGAYRRYVLQDKLRQEWERYVTSTQNIDAYRDGVLHFVHDYGITGLFSVLPATRAGLGNAAVQATNDVWHFRTEEPDAYNENQDVIGLFFAGGSAGVPNDKGAAGFSLPLYMGQKAAGERVQKEQDFIDDAMREWGWMLYNPKAKEIDGSGMESDVIALAKDTLKKQITDLTGGAWTGRPLDSGKTTTLIEHVKDALNDEAVRSLGSAPYIATYMQKRDDVIAELHRLGRPANLGAKQNQETVLPLITLAQQLIQQDGTGAFNNAWNRLFVNEFGG